MFVFVTFFLVMEETGFSGRPPDGEGGQSHCVFGRGSRFVLEKAIKRSQGPLRKVKGMAGRGERVGACGFNSSESITGDQI